jgi:hypothetical protein
MMVLGRIAMLAVWSLLLIDKKARHFSAVQNSCYWHCASFRVSPGSVEVEGITDIAGDSLLARNFCRRYSRRDGWQNGHAENVAKSRD